jgi:hypothetical protein
MTEPIRIAVSDEAEAASLTNQLVGPFSLEVRRSGESREVVVALEGDRDLVRLLEAVESWLEESGVARIRLQVDGRSYCMSCAPDRL